MRIKSEQYLVFEKAMNKAGFKSLNEFAKAIGEPKSSLSRYFNGSRQLPADTLCVVAYNLKTTPNKLLAAMGYKIRRK
jgi:transcriptional regulator with XRE-family HTH domain